MRRMVAVLIMSLLSASVARAQRTDISRVYPIYNNNGKPDLTLDFKQLTSQMQIVDRLFEPGSCELVEGSIGGIGYRRLLRFSTAMLNAGDGDLIVGTPWDPTNPYHDLFVYSLCSGHYYLLGYTNYQLLNLDRSIAGQGNKQTFCLEDDLHYTNDIPSHGYACANQEITSGWADLYYKQLSGQWIDITGIPEGDYIVHVEINAAGSFAEGSNLYPDVFEIRIHVPDPRKKVAVDDSPLLTD
jgi:hypothetical protein